MFEGSNPLADILPGKHVGMISKMLGRVIDICVILLIVALPLWFMPITLDVLELNKQTLLIILTLIASVAWIGKALLERSFSLTRSWLHLAVLGFIGGYAITSWFSLDRYLSFVGNFGQMQWAFSTVAALALMYFVIVNRFRSAGQVYDLLLWFLLGALISGIYGFLQMIGLHVFGGVAGSNGFNTIGTVNALGVFMVVPTVLAASLTVLGCREKTCILSHESWKGKFWHGVIWATLIVGLLNAVAIDYWVVWAGLLFGDVLLVAIPFIRTRRFGHPVTLVVPSILALLSILLLLFRTPINLNLPSEVSPSALHSWQIAQQVIRDAPLFGSGPGTWIFDYAKYRSVEVNLSQFWNIRFERGLSAFLTLAAMLGVIGTAFWILLVLSAVVKSGMHLVREKNDDLWQAYLTVFTSWITLVFLAFCYNYNVAHHAAFWFLLALLGVMVSNGEWSWNQHKGSALTAILSVLFMLGAVGAIAGIWLTGQRLAGEIAYSQSVNAFQAGNDDINYSINKLKAAVALNPLNDVYYRNLSQAELVAAGRLLQGKPTDEQGRQIRSWLDDARTTSKMAADISPANVDNWSNQAAVYQAIASFTPGAEEVAINNYQEALKREPNNPSFMNEIGKLHVLRADAYATLLNSPDQATKTKAQNDIRTELDQAADWFNKSITAKPDYAPAHFDLGIVYEREGKLKDAIGKLEQVLAASPQDVGVAFQLGTLYARDNNRDAARALFEQIVKIQPDYANARWLLAAIYEEDGRYQDAIDQLKPLQASGQSASDITTKIADLQKKLTDKSKPTPGTPLPPPVSEGINAVNQNPVKAQ